MSNNNQDQVENLYDDFGYILSIEKINYENTEDGN